MKTEATLLQHKNNCRIGNNFEMNERMQQNVKDSLSDQERKELLELEAVLAKEGETSLQTAKALFLIKSKRLYRGHKHSMKTYGAKWGFSPAYTTRLTQSGEIYFRLESLWKNDPSSSPTSAWQLRPLVRLKDEANQKAAWKEAVDQTQNGSPTATAVEQCVAKLMGVSSTSAASRCFVRIDLERIPGLARAVLLESKRRHLPLKETVIDVLSEVFDLGSRTKWNHHGTPAVGDRWTLLFLNLL